MKTNPMKIILFGNTPNERIGRLQKLVNDHLPNVQVKPIVSFGHLSQYLRKPLHRVAVIVMFLSSEDAIGHALGLMPLFHDTRLILALTKNDVNALSAAARLHPSFISYPGMGLNDILSVLRKIFIKTSGG